MFGYRSDGVKVKDKNPIGKIMPHIMEKRNDGTNYNVEEVRCENMDTWIAKQREENKVSYNYMHILVAGAVRIFATRPKINRFVINRRVYQRNGIYMSITVKQSLSDDAPDVTTKIRFTGQESISEVKAMVDNEIMNAIKKTDKNKTQNVANLLTCVPNFFIGLAVGFLKLLDRWGLLGKKIIEASPFHTSFYITNLKSIKSDFIFHHLYNFGNTGMFFSMGKEKLVPVVNENEKIEVGKVMKLGISTDERFVDGFYYLKSLRQWKEYMDNPTLLEQRIDIDPVESKKERKKRLKQLTKQQKINKNINQ